MKEITYTEKDRAIVATLKNFPEGLTLAQLSEQLGSPVAPGTIRSSIKKGLVEISGEADIVRISHRKVNTYEFVSAEVFADAKEKPYNYTELMTAILNVLKDNGAMSLAEVAKALGEEKIASGTMNALVRRGNVVKGEPVEIAVEVKDKVAVYNFLADVPAE